MENPLKIFVMRLLRILPRMFQNTVYKQDKVRFFSWISCNLSKINILNFLQFEIGFYLPSFKKHVQNSVLPGYKYFFYPVYLSICDSLPFQEPNSGNGLRNWRYLEKLFFWTWQSLSQMNLIRFAQKSCEFEKYLWKSWKCCLNFHQES